MLYIDLGSGVALLVLAAVVGAGLWWAWQVSRGVRFHPIILAVVSAGCVLLFLTIETGSWLGFEDVAPVDLGLFAFAVAVAWLVSARTTRMLPRSEGHPRYRGNPWLVVTWLALLLLDVFVQQWILGRVSFLHLVVVRGLPVPADPGSISHPYRLVLEIVDALFALGTGVTLGNNLGIYWIFGRKHFSNRGSQPARAP